MLLTLNVYLWPYYLKQITGIKDIFKNDNKDYRYNKIIKLVNEIKPNFILFQEFYNNNLKQKLHKDLSTYSICSSEYQNNLLDSGLIILSKDFIDKYEFIQFNKTNDIMKYINRGFLVAYIKDYIIINVHLHPPELKNSIEIRLIQFKFIIDYIQKINIKLPRNNFTEGVCNINNFIIGGDFNTSIIESNKFIELLNTNLNLNFKLFISKNPTVKEDTLYNKCDYVISNLQINDTEVLDIDVSDHYPVHFKV